MAAGDEGLVDFVSDGVEDREDERAEPMQIAASSFDRLRTPRNDRWASSLIDRAIRQPIENRVLGDVRALFQQKIPPRLGGGG